MALYSGRLGLNSIQGRLTAIALFFIVGTSATMGIAGFRMTVNYESVQFREHFNLLASYMASNAELGVLIGNREILEELVDNMLKVSDVQRVEIADRQGKLILRREHSAPDLDLETVTAPVYGQAMDRGESLFLPDDAEVEMIGKVSLAYSLSGLVELKQRMALRFVFISLALAVAPVLMYWTLSRAISAPLQELLGVAGAVSRGQLDVRAHRNSLREIDTLSGAINEMLDALERQRWELNEANAIMARNQVLAEVGKFSMTVAHEIKNPLTIINGSLDIFRKGEQVDGQTKQRMMGFVDEEIVRIDRLIEDFLLFARPRPPEFVEVSANGLIDSLLQRVSLFNPEIAIRVDAGIDGTGRVHSDQQLLERALLNVVRNAVEASSSPGQVLVEVAKNGNALQFRVSDDGPGVDPESLEKIFDPFVTCKAKGTGLGLSIARNVLNAHGGMICAANRDQGGALFVVSLPLLGEEGDAHCSLEDMQ
ncbi:MAG: hypothetical protein C0614_08310 [Desulfuromonas sp.]|nr:MAG: hypothetical protein C0614_08310 [Desulfuromonas sp.]